MSSKLYIEGGWNVLDRICAMTGCDMTDVDGNHQYRVDGWALAWIGSWRP